MNKPGLKNVNLFLQIIAITSVSLLTDETKTNTRTFYFLKIALEYYSESVKETFSKFFKSELSLPLTKNGTFN
jgi:hypothetical protein